MIEENERISIAGIRAANPNAPSDEFRVEFYPDGKVKKVGYAVRAGLCEGRIYYPSGTLQYEGSFFRKGEEPESDYYGPTYPTWGRFYSERLYSLYQSRKVDTKKYYIRLFFQKKRNLLSGDLREEAMRTNE